MREMGVPVLSSRGSGHRFRECSVPSRAGPTPSRFACGAVVQMVSTPDCHSGGRGFEPRRLRQKKSPPRSTRECPRPLASQARIGCDHPLSTANRPSCLSARGGSRSRCQSC